LLLFELVDADEIDSRDASDAEREDLLLSMDVPRVSWILVAVDLALVDSLCCAWAFANAEPEGSLRNRDPSSPFFFWPFVGMECPVVEFRV
jgi:hypothetical protein